MLQKQRNSKGQFVRDHVNLTNDFKGLEINQDKPVKPVNVVLIVSIMVIIFGLLVLGDYLGWIQLTNNGGF